MYESHMLYHKNKQKERDRVTCELCGKRVYDMKAHMKSHKADREVFPCDQCDKKYLSRIFLNNHQSSVHLNVRYQCEFCDKSFRTKTYYIDHLETHERAIECSKCSSTFTNKVSYRRHLRKCVQLQPPQMCDICGKALSSSETLRKHKITHTGERPYKCSLCPQAFAQRGTRDDHVRTHTNERPHACPICGKTFIQRTACRVHVKSHNKQHGPMHYMCCICNKKLATAGHLKLHIKSHGAEMLS